MLEERMKEKADLYNQLGNKGYNCIPLRDAIRIAKEFTTEMCKKQREICVIEAVRTKLIGADGTLAETINNAPLVIEVE